MMAGNTDLNATSDAVGSTTVADLLSWGTTRKAKIESAHLEYDNAYENAKTKWVDDGNEADMFHSGNSATSSYFDWTKSWYDYDENFS